MALIPWKVVVTDLSYVPQGEITNASSRSLSIALNKVDTASFTIRADNQFSNLVQSMDCYIKIYRSGTLMFYGPVYATQESYNETGVHITANCVGPAFQLAKRIPQKGVLPVSITGARAYITQQLLTNLNVQYLSVNPAASTVLEKRSIGETGLTTIGTATAGGTVTYGVPPWKYMQEILVELAAGSDGFDWRFIPVDNWSNGALVDHKIAQFTSASPMSTDRPEALFQLGGKANIKSYERNKTRENQSQFISHLLNGQPDTNPITANSVGNTAYAGVGIQEDVVQADITDTTLRTNLVAAHLSVRSAPKDTVNFEPIPSYDTTVGNLPYFGNDYNVGDTVRASASVTGSYQQNQFSGVFRVWGVNISVDVNGVEKIAPILAQE